MVLGVAFDGIAETLWRLRLKLGVASLARRASKITSVVTSARSVAAWYLMLSAMPSVPRPTLTAWRGAVLAGQIS